MKRFFAAFFAAALILSISAWASTPKEVKIKTNAHCDNCKAKIEKGLEKVEGIDGSSLDLTDKVVTVKYDSEKTDPAKIRKAISALGYSADNVKSVKKDDCCKTNKKGKKNCKNDENCKPQQSAPTNEAK